MDNGERSPRAGTTVVELTRDTVTNTVRTVSDILSQWPMWAVYAAGAWSLMYGALGMYWTLGGGGFPFGAENDPGGAALSVLASVQAETVAPVIAGLGLIGAVAALTMTRTWRRGFLRTVLLSFAWSGAAVLLLVVPDARGLIAVALVPIVLIGAPFGWPPGTVFDAVPWPVVNQFVLMSGGFLWSAAAVAYQRRGRDACSNCGRTDAGTGWTTPAMATRWGWCATAVAVIVPVIYAVTRWAWVLGIPLGVTDEFLSRGQASGEFWAGATLGAVAVGGALLTLGLSQRWGEKIPHWVPGLAGKRVPIWLAVVPALLLSVLVTTAGLMFVRRTVLGTTVPLTGGDWGAIAPELLWPIWGIALGAATLAYYYRRRGRCRHCGRGPSVRLDSLKDHRGKSQP